MYRVRYVLLRVRLGAARRREIYSGRICKNQDTRLITFLPLWRIYIELDSFLVTAFQRVLHGGKYLDVLFAGMEHRIDFVGYGICLVFRGLCGL